jgi:hypothetical protein
MSVERIEPPSRGQAVHSRAGELVEEGRRLNERLERYFRAVTETIELAREAGSDWRGPILPPLVDAAWAVYQSRGPREDRVELATVGPVPMMEIEE